MSPALAWLALLAAGMLDVAWAIAMKQSQGYTRPQWTFASLMLLAAFVVLLGKALQVLPVGVAYAVWAGVGAVGTVLAGHWLFGEALGAAGLAGVALVLAGIVLLKLATA